MNRPDQPKFATKSNNQMDMASLDKPRADSTTKVASLSASPSQVRGFDWLALGVVILISAFFAFTARLNSQPATSFVPIAVLSATGCGLLVTALHKLHTLKGIGLLEAALGGFFIAIFQFIVAITYPGVFDTLYLGQTLPDDFLITWGLITGFSIVFSIVGAVTGHLAFAPLRLMPARSSPTANIETEDSDPMQEELPADHATVEEDAVNVNASSEGEENTAWIGEQDAIVEDTLEAVSQRQPTRSALSYLITILLLGLAPTVVAYIFSAVYDFTLGLNQFVPGPYPTLRLLSSLLPWQIPLPIDLSTNIRTIIIFSLLWRIPLFLGNPTLFDLQALQPYIFNSAALGLLLLTMHRHENGTVSQPSQPGWVTYLSLEAALGFVLVLPANLWALQGLEGLLQFHEIVIPIRTLSILNPLMFCLNLVTGPLVCIAIGIALRWFLKNRKA